MRMGLTQTDRTGGSGCGQDRRIRMQTGQEDQDADGINPIRMTDRRIRMM